MSFPHYECAGALSDHRQTRAGHVRSRPGHARAPASDSQLGTIRVRVSVFALDTFASQARALLWIGAGEACWAVIRPLQSAILQGEAPSLQTAECRCPFEIATKGDRFALSHPVNLG